MAIQALARSEIVTSLAAWYEVSREFVYQQTHKVVAALDGALMFATPDDEVLFELAVTKASLCQRGGLHDESFHGATPKGLSAANEVFSAQAMAATYVRAESALKLFNDKLCSRATPWLFGNAVTMADIFAASSCCA